LGPNLKIEIRGQFVNFKILRGQIIIIENFEGPICNFWKFIGVKLKILRTKMQNLNNYNNEEFYSSYLLGVISNSLNLI